MKNKIKTVLVSLAALAMLSTTPIQTNAYNINEPKILVQSQKRDLHINFSKDGKKFVYSRMRDINLYQVESELVINENGIEKVVTQGYADMKPAFSPDGKKIAFFRNVGMGYGDIYVVDVDGKNLEEIIPSMITKISWSPDGKELVFTCDGEEEKTHIITKEEAEAVNKQSKPTDRKYKQGDVVTYKEFYTSIAKVNIKTKELKILTINDGNYDNPEFTDDGKILYLYNKDKGTNVGKELWVMDKDGNNKKLLIQLENNKKRTVNEDKSVTLQLKEGTVDAVSYDNGSIAYLTNTRERIVQLIPKKKSLDYDTKEIKDGYVSSVYIKNLKTGETKLVTDEGNIWFPELKNNQLYFSRCISEETDHDIYSIDLK